MSWNSYSFRAKNLKGETCADPLSVVMASCIEDRRSSFSRLPQTHGAQSGELTQGDNGESGERFPIDSAPAYVQEPLFEGRVTAL